jgi:hypothetical protein
MRRGSGVLGWKDGTLKDNWVMFDAFHILKQLDLNVCATAPSQDRQK